MLKVNKTENIQSCWTSEVFSEYNIVLAALFGEIKVYIFEDQYTVHRWHTSWPQHQLQLSTLEIRMICLCHDDPPNHSVCRVYCTHCLCATVWSVTPREVNFCLLHWCLLCVMLLHV